MTATDTHKGKLHLGNSSANGMMRKRIRHIGSRTKFFTGIGPEFFSYEYLNSSYQCFTYVYPTLIPALNSFQSTIAIQKAVNGITVARKVVSGGLLFVNVLMFMPKTEEMIVTELREQEENTYLRRPTESQLKCTTHA